MAKKTVATLQTSSKKLTKAIKMVKSPKSGAYTFNIMAKKGNRVQVILECTEHKDSGKPGTSRYISTKNKKNSPERLELKKFNPILKKYTIHKEIK